MLLKAFALCLPFLSPTFSMEFENPPPARALEIWETLRDTKILPNTPKQLSEYQFDKTTNEILEKALQGTPLDSQVLKEFKKIGQLCQWTFEVSPTNFIKICEIARKKYSMQNLNRTSTFPWGDFIEALPLRGDDIDHELFTTLYNQCLGVQNSLTTEQDEAKIFLEKELRSFSSQSFSDKTLGRLTNAVDEFKKKVDSIEKKIQFSSPIRQPLVLLALIRRFNKKISDDLLMKTIQKAVSESEEKTLERFPKLDRDFQEIYKARTVENDELSLEFRKQILESLEIILTGCQKDPLIPFSSSTQETEHSS